MNHDKQRLPNYLLVFFIPVALVTLVIAGMNLYAFLSLRQTQQAFMEKDARNFSDLAALSRFNQEITAIQRQVMSTLAAAKQGRLDAGQVYRLHSSIVDRLALVENELLPMLPLPESGDASKQEVASDFAVYRNLILQATDLATVDPPNAMQHAYQAAQQFIHFVEHTRSIALGISNAATESAAESDRLIAARSMQLTLNGSLLMIVLLLIWFYVARHLSRRLTTLTVALEDIAAGDTDTDTLADLRKTKQETRSPLAPIASAILIFRETKLAEQRSQENLGERMKEISCLYDVFNLTEDHDIELDLMLSIVAERLPPALHFPAIAAAFIECGGKRFGHPALNEEFAISADFTGRDGQSARIVLGYLAPPPVPADARFLPEEGELLATIAARLESTIERRRIINMEKAAVDQVRKLSLAVDQSPASIVITNLDARIEYVNQTFIRNTGYSHEEALGLNPRVLKSGKTPSAIYSDMWETLGRGEPWTGELVNRRKDGSEYVEHAKISPVRQTDGTITHYLAIKEDITERKRIETELTQHRLHLEELVAERTTEVHLAKDRAEEISHDFMRVLDATPDMVALKDADRRFKYVSRTYIEASGKRSPEDFRGKTAEEIFPPALASRIRTEEDEQLRSGCDLITDERPITLAQGVRRHMAFTRSVLRHSDGSIVGFLIQGRDITALKHGEIDLRAAKEAADAANRAKSEFLANMSHEIRTPMNAIIGLAHLLRRDISHPHQNAQLAKISTAAHHLLNIINDILDLSKIEAGKLHIEATDFEPERIIANLITLVHEKAEAKGVELVVAMAGIPPVLHGDGLRLGQVLLNFIGNAVKFTEKGSITLRASVISAKDTDLTLRFEVADTGIGLTAEQKARLFQAFEQADASTTRKYGGTGLGLAISRRLTEMMGGKIGVDSVSGQGSTFWIEVPFGYGRSEPGREKRLAETRGLRALIIDDLPEARESLADMLGMLGMQVETTSNGPNGLERIASADAAGTPFDLMLCDWQMPELNGLEVGQRLAGLPLEKPPGHLLVTSYGDSLSPEMLAASGYYAVLHKPVTPSALHDTIQEMLCGYRRERTEFAPGEAESLLRRRKGIRVLLAEDNPINQEVSVELLAQVGIEIDVANDGQEAVDFAQRSGYDAILMDMQMPVVSGIDATRMIRGIERHARTPILAMTANAFDEDRTACLAAGMNDHIAKPVDPEVLYATLLRWIPIAVGEAASPDEAVPPAPTFSGSAPADLMQRLDAIPGLNVASGLRAANGRADLYLRLLLKFLDNRDSLTLQKALARNETNEARRAAHTLKGIAATLGAHALRDDAGRIEKDLSSPPDSPDRQDITARIDRLHADYVALTTAVREILPVENLAKTPVAPDAVQLRELCNKLEALLASDDMAAGSLYRDHQALIEAGFGKASHILARQIEDFAFDEALATLREALATVGGATPSAPTSPDTEEHLSFN